MAAIAKSLRNAPYGLDDYTEFLWDLLDDADATEADDRTFEESFRFFERNAASDLGAPGPLVHFLERAYPRYCGHLRASVRRRATTHTLCMVNRLLNGREEHRVRAELLTLLADVAAQPDVAPDVRAEARRFLELHAQPE